MNNNNSSRADLSGSNFGQPQARNNAVALHSVQRRQNNILGMHHNYLNSKRRSKLQTIDKELINKDLHPVQNQKIFEKARNSVQPKHSIPLPMLNLGKEQRINYHSSHRSSPMQNIQISVKRKHDQLVSATQENFFAHTNANSLKVGGGENVADNESQQSGAIRNLNIQAGFHQSSNFSQFETVDATN